jgi:hypothetical protein
MIGWRLAERDPHYYNGCWSCSYILENITA